MSNKKFDIDEQFKFYMATVFGNVKQFSPNQLTELKRAFFAGMSQTLFHVQDRVLLLPKSETHGEITGIIEDLKKWWNNEVKNNLPKN